MDDINHGESRQPEIVGVATMLLFVSSLAVVLRLLFRRWTDLGLWYDDYTIIVALVCSSLNSSLVLTDRHNRYCHGFLLSLTLSV